MEYVNTNLEAQRQSLLSLADEPVIEPTVQPGVDIVIDEEDEPTPAVVVPPVVAPKTVAPVVPPDADDADADDDSSYELGASFFSKAGIEADDKVTTLDELATVTKGIIDGLRGEINSYKEDSLVNDLIEWRKKGGDLDNFKTKPIRYDYSSVNLEDVETQKEAIRQLRRLDEDDDSLIEEEIDYLEQTNRLKERAVKSLTRLDKLNEQEVKSFDDNVAGELAQQQQEINQIWQEVKATIDTGVINGFTLSKEDKDAFSKHVLRDAKGVSQAEQKRNTITLGQQLLIDYIIMKDFNVKGLQSTKAVIEPGTRTLAKIVKGDYTKNKASLEELSLAELSVLNQSYKQSMK